MDISNCELNKLVWQAGTQGELYIDSCRVNQLSLDQTTLSKDSVISVVNSSIHVAQFQQVLVKGQLILRNIQALADPSEFEKQKALTGLDEKDEREEAEEKYEKEIRELEKQFPNRPAFLIVDSSLGKSEITGSNLEGFHFAYRNSRILEIFLSGTRLPKEKIETWNEDSALASASELVEQKILIHNQLKKIFENQGDVVEAIWFHAKTMNYQEELLRISYKAGGRRIFSEPWFELIAFKLNKTSSEHGKNWGRAAAFTFKWSAIIFLLYLVLVFSKSFHVVQVQNWSQKRNWQFLPDFLSFLCRYAGDYFQFIDPTHKVDFMVQKEKLTLPAKFLDFIARIVIGYGIYQLIAAFRKYGKKNG